jgi:hypothetical protein
MGTNRVLRLTSQGELRCYELTANGEHYAAIKAPASLAGAYTLTLPTALPGSTLFMTCTTGGVLDFAAGSSSLQSGYDAGEDIALSTLKVIDITQSLNEGMMTLTKTGVSGGVPLTITNAGTGAGLSIVQSGDANAILATRAAGSTPIVDLAGTGVISGTCLKIAMPSAGSGKGIDLAQSGTGVAASFLKTAGSEPNIDIVCAGAISGAGCRITMPSAGSGIGVDIANAGSGKGILVTQTGTGIGLQVSKTGGSAAVVDIVATSTISGAGCAITMPSAGSGIGISLAQDGSGIGIQVAQTTIAAGLKVTQSSASASGRCAIFEKTGAGTGTCVDITHAGNSGIALRVITTNAVTVIDATQGNDTYCIHAKNTMAGATSPVIKMTSSATSKTQMDMEGTSGLWSIQRWGVGYFPHIDYGLFQNYTVASGAIAIFGTVENGSIAVAGEGGAADDLDNITMAHAAFGNPIIILKAVSDTVTITVRNDGGGTGNIRCEGDFVMDSEHDRMVLQWESIGSKWVELSRSNNGA